MKIVLTKIVNSNQNHTDNKRYLLFMSTVFFQSLTNLKRPEGPSVPMQLQLFDQLLCFFLLAINKRAYRRLPGCRVSVGRLRPLKLIVTPHASLLVSVPVARIRLTLLAPGSNLKCNRLSNLN